MQKAIFLDIDSLLIVSDDDVAVLPGVEAALKYYQNQIPCWVMVGISNFQGMGVEKAIAFIQHILELLPQLQAVYFCADEKGLICWRVTSAGAVVVDGSDDGIEIPPELRYRSKSARMIHQAATDFGIDLTQSWLVGDDEQCAAATAINFMDSETWCDRFRPGMYEVKPVTIEQVKFLESLRFSNDNN